MRHYGKEELASLAHITWGRETVYRRPELRVREGASMRLAAAMAEPGGALLQDVRGGMSPFAVQPAENDAQYFRRRSAEESQAAAEAVGPEARAAHLDLATRYARLSQRGLPAAERKRRLDDRLDEALIGTFPASDPMSIVHVR